LQDYFGWLLSALTRLLVKYEVLTLSGMFLSGLTIFWYYLSVASLTINEPVAGRAFGLD